jgi:hypothetical protein
VPGTVIGLDFSVARTRGAGQGAILTAGMSRIELMLNHLNGIKIVILIAN